MDILERIEDYLEEMAVASGSAAMGGDGSMGNPGTTTTKVAKYQRTSSIMTGGKSRKKKKRTAEPVLDGKEQKRFKKDTDRHRYASDEVDHSDSDEAGPNNKKRVKSGSQNMTTGIGWHLRQS